MRWLMLGVAVLAVAGCSKAPDSPAGRLDASADNMTPGVDVTAAPGVAFIYSYVFRLPAQRIEGLQEAHARACEQLGLARCRITGVKLKLVGENDIEAELDLKLAPAIARAFGRDAGKLVEQASGKTVDTEITGTDAGVAIERATADHAHAAAAVHQVDARLARAHGQFERGDLQDQRTAAADQVAAADASAAEARASLASTPMTFNYESGPAVRGFDMSAPITSSLDTAVGSAQVTLAVVLALLAIFGPPALAALLIWLAIRPLRAAWRRRRGVPVATEPVAG